jgi:hypothetical protein
VLHRGRPRGQRLHFRPPGRSPAQPRVNTSGRLGPETGSLKQWA